MILTQESITISKDDDLVILGFVNVPSFSLAALKWENGVCKYDKKNFPMQASRTFEYVDRLIPS